MTDGAADGPIVRIFSVEVEPGAASELERIEDKIATLYTRDNGYIDGRFIVDREAGIWGNVGFWESRAAVAALRDHPLMQSVRAQVAPLLQAPPREEIYDIYHPRTH